MTELLRWETDCGCQGIEMGCRRVWEDDMYVLKRDVMELSRTLGERLRSGGCPSCAQQRAPSRSPTPASARSPAVENGERNQLL